MNLYLATNYGVVHNAENKYLSSNFNYSVCVFNAMDIIQINGYLRSVLIRFDKEMQFRSDKHIYCYLISPSNKSNSFYISSKYKLIEMKNDLSAQRYYYETKVDEKLFVCNGQYIAISFTNETGFPRSVSRRNQHSLELDQIEKALSHGESVEFNVDSELGVAISFDIEPLLSKITCF